ncbi:hypothetical protein VEE21_05200 [Escherichia coli]|nr:hypothetical protein VEE21_05200 [Escherichia coli]
MLPSETMIWQPEFTDKTLSRKPGAVHVAHDGMPWDNSPCFYNLEEIDRWIERQASARPRRHLT